MDFLKGDPHAIAESLESVLVWWQRAKSIHPHDDDFEVVVERMPDIDDVRVTNSCACRCRSPTWMVLSVWKWRHGTRLWRGASGW